MEISLAILRIVYVIVFFTAIFISLKFQLGEESKDERGQSILNKSYGLVFPMLPLGWFLIELYEYFIARLDYDTYKTAIWFLVTGLLILHATIITVLKRRY